MGALDHFPKFPKTGKTGAPDFPEIPAPPLGGGKKRELRETGRVHCWIVTLPNRAPFPVWCIQGATENEMLAQWPGALLEPHE